MVASSRGHRRGQLKMPMLKKVVVSRIHRLALFRKKFLNLALVQMKHSLLLFLKKFPDLNLMWFKLSLVSPTSCERRIGSCEAEYAQEKCHHSHEHASGEIPLSCARLPGGIGAMRISLRAWIAGALVSHLIICAMGEAPTERNSNCVTRPELGRVLTKVSA